MTAHQDFQILIHQLRSQLQDWDDLQGADCPESDRSNPAQSNPDRLPAPIASSPSNSDRSNSDRSNSDRLNLAPALAQLQAHYQTQLLSAPSPSDSSQAARFQSLQTEIAKQMRLLGLDGLFLKTARHPEKFRDRLQHISQRLELLDKYCAAIVALAENR